MCGAFKGRGDGGVSRVGRGERGEKEERSSERISESLHFFPITA
jgi:hypothetical protein